MWSLGRVATRPSVSGFEPLQTPIMEPSTMKDNRHTANHHWPDEDQVVTELAVQYRLK